jgi:hypothetical protein
VHWGDALPADEKEQAEVAVLKKQIGFSNDTLISGMGGDPEKERTQRKADAKETAENFMNELDRGGAGLPGAGAEDDDE